MGSDAPHILLLEEEPTSREAMTGLLRNSGFTVTAVEKGNVAIDLLAPSRNGGTFSLLITTAHPPDFAVLDTIQRFTELEVSIPVLMITGFANSAILSRIFHLSDVETIARPFSDQELISRIHNRIRVP